MTDTHKWQLLAFGLVFGGLVYLLAPVLTPFAIAALIAFLGDPLVDRLEALRVPRGAAVAIVFAAFFVLLLLVPLLLVPPLRDQLTHLIERLPVYINFVQDAVLPRIEEFTGFTVERLDPAGIVAMLKSHWQQAGGIVAQVLGSLSKSGLAVLAFLVNALLVPVLSFYLMRDWDVLIARIRELLPRAIEPTVSELARQSNEVLGSFLRGQLSVMLALGAIYAFGLWLVGIDLALLIGMLAGLISFIPYLGAIVGVGAGVIAALVQYGDLSHVVLVLLVFGVGQLVESFLLTPWLVGDRIGLHPVAVIFAIMAGGQLFGFLGVLLALPVAAVGMVLLRYAHERYTASTLYGASKPAPEVVAEAPPLSVAQPVTAPAQTATPPEPAPAPPLP